MVGMPAILPTPAQSLYSNNLITRTSRTSRTKRNNTNPASHKPWGIISSVCSGVFEVARSIVELSQTLNTYQVTMDMKVPSNTSPRSEEHTSELQSLMRISYAVFCLKNKKNKTT